MPTQPRYAAALDCKETIRRSISSPLGLSSIDARARAMFPAGTPANDAQIAQERRKLGSIYGWMLGAEPYFVDAQISDLVAASAQSLPEWSLTPDMFPTPDGFAYFARPIQLPITPEDDGHPSLLHAIAWVQAEESHSPAANDGSIYQLEKRHGGELSIGVAVSFMVQAHQGMDYIEPTGVSLMRYGSSFGEITGKIPEMEQSGRVQNGAKLHAKLSVLGALLLFIAQKLVISTPEPVDRATRRAAQREQRPEPAPIRVIRLRRVVYESGHKTPGGSVDWAWQWAVRGHWRQQAFGPNHSLRRPQWISAYWKGPEDAPAKPVPASIFVVDR